MPRVPTFTEIGQRIRALRLERGYSQDCLAQALGVTRPVVTKIEGGKKAINSIELAKICELFDCTFEELTREPEDDKLVIHFRDGQINDPEFNSAASQIEYILDEIIGQLEIRRDANGKRNSPKGTRRVRCK